MSKRAPLLLRQESYRKTVKSFDVRRVTIQGSQQALMVICPQAACGQWFVVGLYWGRQDPSDRRRRPCPHCYRTALVPAKLPPRRT